MAKEDGIELRAMLENKTVGTLNTFYHPDFVSFFSSRGPVSPFYIKPDLVAPGVFVNTTSIHGGYNLTSGTSFAAPHVSGAAAILLEKNPDLSPQQVKSIISTTADPVSDTFGTLFPQEISGIGRLNITKAFDANLIVNPDYAIFDLSPFTKSQIAQFNLDTIDHTKPDPKIEIKFDHPVAKFDYWIDGSTLFVKADLVEQKAGQYQGSIIIYDKVVHHVPILLRVADGTIKVLEDDGRLGFKIDSKQSWSYAKISVYNENSRLVDSVSTTPTKDSTITIRDPGKYWIQADLKSGQNATTIYNTIMITNTNHGFDFDIGVPYQPLVILGGIGVVIGIVGLVIRRK
jgi:minor extracellular serine protease Vpr